MDEEPKSQVNVPGIGAVGIGDDAKDVDVQTNVNQGGGGVIVHGNATIVQQSGAGSTTPSFTPPPRLAYIPFPALGSKFAGRLELLVTLARELQPGRTAGLSQRAALQADGGVGKTALAVELGWRLFDEQRFDYVLLLNATSPETLNNDLAALCERDRLNLPEQEATDQQTRFQGVLAWLQAPDNARRTLLLLDNADAPEARAAIRALHPRLPGCALLVTSRSALGGGIPEHRLDLFTAGEARDFLRTHLDPQYLREKDTASTDALLDGLATSVDHLPLALEIVCSYLRETFQSPREWLSEWQAAPEETLEHHNPAGLSYPVSLSRVWEQSFARLSPKAQQQLQILCWLAPRPAAIPLAPLKKREDWTERRKWLGELEKLSLIQRTRDEANVAGDGDSITIHRILQAVVRARTSNEEREAARAAAVALLNGVIPGPLYETEGWRLWQRLQPHLNAVIGHVADTPQETPATRVIGQYALWLYERAQYSEAEPLMRRALAIDEKSLGPDHPDVAHALNDLALLLQETDRLTEAEPLMRRALAIGETSLGPDHPNVATRLNNLALLLQETNRLTEAEPLMRRALAIDETSLGPDHTNAAIDLNNLAQLLQATNRLTEAEPLMRRALAIGETSLGPDHPQVASQLNNLAQLLQETNRRAEAEPLMRRALAIDEKSLGPDHPNVAIRLNNLAQLLQATNRLAEAEPLMRRALAIGEKGLGPDHPQVATQLNNLALLLQETNRLTEAEPLMRRALAIDEKSLGPDHPNVAIRLNNLAQLLQATNRLTEAEPLMRRALAIDERSLGPDHPQVASQLNNLARLLQETDRLPEAEPLLRRALAILLRAEFLTGHTLPRTAPTERNYRFLLEVMEWPTAQIDDHIAQMQREAASGAEGG